MGFLEDLMGAIEAPNPLDAVNGAISGFQDTKGLIGDVFEGDVHGALTNGRKLIGDAKDVVQGLSGLGVNLGPVPGIFANSKLIKLADSKVLSAAQLVISGMKATTGSGEPYDGDGFIGSAERLEKCVDTLIGAEPHFDRWDGTASQVYNATNASHRRLTSDVQVADTEIAAIIRTEADQVVRTRQSLDDTSQHLYDFGLATAWMNAVPGGAVAKFIADTGAAGTATAAAGVTMEILAINALENALRIREHVDKYGDAAKDTSGDVGACDPFPVPKDDLPAADKATPLPMGETVIPPSRLGPETPYTVPEPEEPPVSGPPATPYHSPTYHSPTPAAPAPAAPATPSSAAPAPAARGPAAPPSVAPASTAPNSRTTSPPQPRTPVREGAQAAVSDGQRVPIDLAVDVDGEPRVATGQQGNQQGK